MEGYGYGLLEPGKTKGAKRNLTTMFFNTKRVNKYHQETNQKKLLKQ